MDSKLTRRLLVPCGLVLASTALQAQSVPTVSLTPLPQAAAAAPSGPELMRAIVQRISSHATVEAKVRHRSEMFGQRLVGTGRYLQASQQQRLRVRFSLSVKTAERSVDLLHVCDGRILWMFDTLDGKPRLSRVDLPRLRQAVAENGPTIPLLSGGGLPQLLGSLERDFVPAAPKAVVFQDVPVWALALYWKPARLARRLGQAEPTDAPADLPIETLPEQMPDRIFLLVGQDDLFPYHIDYRRSDPGQPVASPRSGNQSASRSLTTMEMFEVQFNAPLDPLHFVYSPPANIQIDDRTDEYLSQLRPRERKK